jgi:putative multiple sugar transport system ATP-binding protein
LKEPPDTLITNIGVGKQQLVEIAKALSKEVRLLILDEPTASLNESDSDALLELLLGIQAARHLLDPDLAQAQRDFAKVADRITVLRDGAHRRAPWIAMHGAVERGPRSSDAWSIAIWRTAIPKRSPKIGETIFEVRDWSRAIIRCMPTGR